jgi:catechol 2,3-dioxygenase-like lactoylglutathione lyase family enzyme
MAPPVRQADHVGIRVRDLDASIQFYTQVLGLALSERQVVFSGNELVFLKMGDAGFVELIRLASPPAPAQPVPAGQAGLQHFCLEVESLDEWLQHLAALGVKVDAGPVSFAVPSANCRCLFIHDPDGTPVELIERTAR